MEDPIRISVAPRLAMSLWLGAVPPLAVGLANGGLAAALGVAFAVACPLLVVSSALAPVRAPRFFPLYFVALFLVALSAFEFNSVAFVVDTWSALILGVVTMVVERPPEIDPEVLARPPRALRRSSAEPWPTPTASVRS
jgi:hypothetical protein